jgi:DNA-binding MarR family transcriptional regulator
MFDSLEQEAYLHLWRTYDRLREIDERVFARHGISAQQYNALRVLRSVHPAGLATAALGARLVSRAPDMTRLLDKLEERGLVRRQRRADNRRVVEAWITSAGATLVKRLTEAVRRCGRDQLGHVDRRTLRTLIAILEQARLPHEADAAATVWPGGRSVRR